MNARFGPEADLVEKGWKRTFAAKGQKLPAKVHSRQPQFDMHQGHNIRFSPNIQHGHDNGCAAIVGYDIV